MKALTKPAKTAARTKSSEMKEFDADPESRPMMTELYRRAEARIKSQRKLPGKKPVVGAVPEDARRLLHVLQVHQLELEMQNAELQDARNRIEGLLEKYTDLYDFAPVGYFTLVAGGTIQLVNLSGALLLGRERSLLVGRSLVTLVAPEFRPAFQTLLRQVFAGHAKQSGDFELSGPDRLPRCVNIKAQRLLNGEECRLVMVDITERKFAEAASAQLAAIVNSSSDAIIGKDMHSMVTSWNAGAEKLFGYSAKEMTAARSTA